MRVEFYNGISYRKTLKHLINTKQTLVLSKTLVYASLREKRHITDKKKPLVQRAKLKALNA